METVFGQTLALRLGDGDKHCALESDMTGLNVKGNLYLTCLKACSTGSKVSRDTLNRRVLAWRQKGNREGEIARELPRKWFLFDSCILPKHAQKVVGLRVKTTITKKLQQCCSSWRQACRERKGFLRRLEGEEEKNVICLFKDFRIKLEFKLPFSFLPLHRQSHFILMNLRM